MGNYFFIKLKHEILDDPKMGTLPDGLWRRAIECFVMAGIQHEKGLLPPVKDMAWKLRTSEDELIKELEQLGEIDIVELTEEGWFVINFAKHQAKIEDAERMREYRKRQRESNADVTDELPDRYDSVTGRSVDKNRIDKKLDTEEEVNGTIVPVNLAGWLEIVKTDKNKQAALLRMFDTLYPKATEKPDFGYIGRVAKNVGGAGRLAALLWECSSKQVTGDVMRYVQAYSKNHNGKEETQEEALQRKGYEV